MASQPEVKEEYHFIKSPESPLHPLHKFSFKIDGCKYSCVQQYVIRQKIETYGSRKQLGDLMKETEPVKVNAFEKNNKIVVNPEAWSEEQKEAMKQAYVEKSRQHKPTHDLLVNTKGKVLVYANPKDVDLGIGLAWNDPPSRQRRNWKGKNLLGEWLKEIQEDIPDFEGTERSGDREMKHQAVASSVEDHTASKRTSIFRDDGQEKFTFFWRSGSPFSQWHPCHFVVDGQSYNCAEQYMMHQKAVFFHDSSIAAQILKTMDPKAQKSLGRKVQGFDDEKWTPISKEVVKKANIAKFSQDEKLKRDLFATAGTTLVEASPVDRIWGIGLEATDPKAKDRRTWLGENRLGQILTEVREELMRGGTQTRKNDAAASKKNGDDEKNAKPSKRPGSNDDNGPPKHRSKSGAGHDPSGASEGQRSDEDETKMDFTQNSSAHNNTGADDPAWDGFDGMDMDIERSEKSKKRDKPRTTRWSEARTSEQDNWRDRSRESSRSGRRNDDPGSEKFTFFWRADSPFSQHHPAYFDLDGCRYNCAEQYYMHMKAVVSGDKQTAREIMSTENPARQKSLAKQIPCFDDNLWKTVRRDIVKRGNIEKFSQNPRLRRMLFATAGTTLVETSPMDNTWGIGLNADDPKAWKRGTWSGTNLLGEILTEVREDLMEKFRNSPDVVDDEDARRTIRHDGSGESYTVFWRPVHPFHPRYPIGFVVDEVNYWTLLQYIVHQKALFFNDDIRAREIMETLRPNKLEELGRKVRISSHREWSKFCRSYLVRGNFAKFSQNRNIRQQLIDNVQNGDAVYAIENDRLLGIGLAEEDKRIYRKKSWKGKNLLGQSLMEVREMIMKNRSPPPDIGECEADQADDEEVSENIFFFFGKIPLSQWHLCRFKESGTTYNSSEQYMLHRCALHFDDPDVAAQILQCHQPRAMQDMYPRNYDYPEWSRVCRDVIKTGNYAKFSQDSKLRDELLKTEDEIIAYTSDDTLLGIGLRESDPRAWDRLNWTGRNLLGEVLMEIRGELKQKGTGRPTSGRSTNRTESWENVKSSPDKSSGEKFTFFWQKSPFSQWWGCSIDINGITYNCTEQYMMHQKALHFKDELTAREIMGLRNPLEQWKLGRRVRNYERNSWNSVCRDIVKQGNVAKFQQHHNMRRNLFETAGTTLVEASPKDAKWGIGIKQDDPRSKCRETWPGRNLLGEILTEIREELMKDERYSSVINSKNDNHGSQPDHNRNNSNNRDYTESPRKDSRPQQAGSSCSDHGKSSNRSGQSKRTSGDNRMQMDEFFQSENVKMVSDASKTQLRTDNRKMVSDASKTQLRNENRSDRLTEPPAKQCHRRDVPTENRFADNSLRNTDKGSGRDQNPSRQTPNAAQTTNKEPVDFGTSGHSRIPVDKPLECNKGTAESGEPKEILYISKSSLNQWHKCSLEADGLEYNSVGKYFYHQKALMFQDEENAAAIYGSFAPNRIMKSAKHIHVEGFDEDKWNLVCRNVLKNGNYYKFSQNEDLKKELLASSGKFLVYDDADKLFGIGLKPDDVKGKDQKNWTGENLLGSVLMELCEDFVQGRASVCSVLGDSTNDATLPTESNAAASSDAIYGTLSLSTEEKQISDDTPSASPSLVTEEVEKVRSVDDDDVTKQKAATVEQTDGKSTEAEINDSRKDDMDKMKQSPLDDKMEEPMKPSSPDAEQTVAVNIGNEPSPFDGNTEQSVLTISEKEPCPSDNKTENSGTVNTGKEPCSLDGTEDHSATVNTNNEQLPVDGNTVQSISTNVEKELCILDGKTEPSVTVKSENEPHPLEDTTEQSVSTNIENEPRPSDNATENSMTMNTEKEPSSLNEYVEDSVAVNIRNEPCSSDGKNDQSFPMNTEKEPCASDKLVESIAEEQNSSTSTKTDQEIDESAPIAKTGQKTVEQEEHTLSSEDKRTTAESADNEQHSEADKTCVAKELAEDHGTGATVCAVAASADHTNVQTTNTEQEIDLHQKIEAITTIESTEIKQVVTRSENKMQETTKYSNEAQMGVLNADEENVTDVIKEGKEITVKTEISSTSIKETELVVRTKEEKSISVNEETREESDEVNAGSKPSIDSGKVEHATGDSITKGDIIQEAAEIVEVKQTVPDKDSALLESPGVSVSDVNTDGDQLRSADVGQSSAESEHPAKSDEEPDFKSEDTSVTNSCKDTPQTSATLNVAQQTQECNFAEQEPGTVLCTKTTSSKLDTSLKTESKASIMPVGNTSEALDEIHSTDKEIKNTSIFSLKDRDRDLTDEPLEISSVNSEPVETLPEI